MFITTNIFIGVRPVLSIWVAQSSSQEDGTISLSPESLSTLRPVSSRISLHFNRKESSTAAATTKTTNVDIVINYCDGGLFMSIYILDTARIWWPQ